MMDYFSIVLFFGEGDEEGKKVTIFFPWKFFVCWVKIKVFLLLLKSLSEELCSYFPAREKKTAKSNWKQMEGKVGISHMWSMTGISKFAKQRKHSAKWQLYTINKVIYDLAVRSLLVNSLVDVPSIQFFVMPKGKQEAETKLLHNAEKFFRVNK
jgi:hypothetical protein